MSNTDSKISVIDRINNVMTTYSTLTSLNSQFIRTFELNELSEPPSCAFCKLINGTDDGKHMCMTQRLNSARNALINDKHVNIFVCITGMTEWSVPIFDSDELIGFIFSGIVNTGVSGQNDIETASIISNTFNVDRNELLGSLASVPQVLKKKIHPYANLLLLLTQLNDLTDIPRKTKNTTVFKNTDPLTNTDASKTSSVSDDNDNHPLSYYISGVDLTDDQMKVFWETIENKALSVFTAIISARSLEGRRAFESIMEYAYSETRLMDVKSSAEMLFHIITLKFASESFYEVRFYKLTFDTISSLQICTSLNQIRDIMLASYQKMYEFYNTDENSDTKKNSVSNNIIRYLEANYDKPITIKDLGAYLFMSPSYISRLFKTETKYTIKQYLTNLRMQHAQDLVLNTSMPVKDIGAAVGYKDDLRGFYKMFLKYFGMTCSNMRKNHFVNTETIDDIDDDDSID